MDRFRILVRALVPGLLALVICVVTLSSSGGERGLTAQHGVLNFGKVDDTLYRGAEPNAVAIANLQQLGIKSIIDLRIGTEVRNEEQAEARAHGILYTNLPLRGLGRPTDDQVKTALSLIQDLQGPVFIHCRHGCDRTGTIVACYRIQHDHWTPKKALEEAVTYGISIYERGMRKYVTGFGAETSKLAKK